MIAIGIVRRFGELVKKAEELTIDDIIQGKTQTEPDITNRYLANLQYVVNMHGVRKGIKFDGATLRDRGPESPESHFGADFVGVLNVKLKGFKQTKGFLAQAKKEGDLVKVQKVQKFYASPTRAAFNRNQEFERLRGQANDMLQISPASFVIVYSSSGFVVVPATSVTGLSKKAKLYAKPATRFFKEFLMCFIGDPRLKAWDTKSLETLRTEYRARSAIIFNIYESNLSESQDLTEFS
jgi:hypothetical protein